MKKVFAAAVAWLLALAAWAQPSIRVEVHNIVEVQERFNVVFVVEGEHSPSDFQWEAGDDFSVVWGPQKGSSTSIQIVNGKTTRSAQTSYTYILQAKKDRHLHPAARRSHGKRHADPFPLRHSPGSGRWLPAGRQCPAKQLPGLGPAGPAGAAGRGTGWRAGIGKL